jgi:hypothetical protein
MSATEATARGATALRAFDIGFDESELTELRQPGRRDLPTRNAYSQRGERARERQPSEQAEVAYRRLVTDWKAARPNKTVAKT